VERTLNREELESGFRQEPELVISGDAHRNEVSDFNGWRAITGTATVLR
jgi:hypothetical protein